MLSPHHSHRILAHIHTMGALFYSYLKFDKTSNILSFCSLKPIVILTPVGNGRVIHPHLKVLHKVHLPALFYKYKIRLTW